MSSITIIPVQEVHTITTLYIQNIFIDIQNNQITIEINKLNQEGKVIDRLTLVASGEDYMNIYDKDALNEFVLLSLGYQT